MPIQRFLGLLLVVLLFPGAARSQGTRLLRQPTVSQTHIAFAYANDLWIVPRTGGDANLRSAS